MSPTPAPTNNPILDEIQRAHASLSPQARTVMERAGITLPQGPVAGLNAPPPEATPAQPKSEPLSPAFSGAPNFPLPPIAAPPEQATAKPTPIQGLPPAMIGNAASPDRPTPMAAPPPGGLIRRPIADFAPKQAEHQTEADRLRDPELGKTGIQKLPGIARVPLQVLDAIGSGLFPNITMGIPGTAAHHMLLQHNADRAVEGDTAAMDAAAKRQLEGSQGTEAEARAAEEPSQGRLRGSQADEAEARAEALRHPSVKADEWVEAKLPQTDPAHPELGPQAVWFNKNDFSQGLKYGNAPVSAIPTEKPPREAEVPLGERVSQLNKAMESRYQVNHPGESLPSQFTLPPNATKGDFENVDKLMAGTEGAISSKAARDATNELRKQTQQIAEQNRREKEQKGDKTAGLKAYTPAMDSAERFNVMTQNYEDATQNHDQQAMLSLLANHLGMTMGLQKGARLTKDIIHEAIQSRPWLQGMVSKFDKNGYLTGVTLTPEQMRQMVNLGRSRFSEDVAKARNEAEYQGINDGGPKRTPNESTINHYTELAHGDPAKAKQLASQDGWSVQ